MPHAELARYGIVGAIGLVLSWAAISDVRNRRIPNATILVMLGLFLPWSLTDHAASVSSGLLAAGLGFLVGYIMYLSKVMGAGDVKLFAAVALFVGLAYLPHFALATVLVGGVMAIISLAVRPRRAAVMLILRGKGDFGRGIPYGVAIAIGGLAVLIGAISGRLTPDILTQLK